MLIAALFVVVAAAEPIEVELGVGGQVAGATHGATYFAGTGVAGTARIYLPGTDLFFGSMTDVAVMPPFVNGTLLGVNAAVSIRESVHAGYRFRVTDSWRLALFAGVAPTYVFEANPDTSGGFVCGAIAVSAAAEVAPSFLVEVTPMASLALYGPLYLFQPSLAVSGIWRIGG